MQHYVIVCNILQICNAKIIVIRLLFCGNEIKKRICIFIIYSSYKIYWNYHFHASRCKMHRSKLWWKTLWKWWRIWRGRNKCRDIFFFFSCFLNFGFGRWCLVTDLIQCHFSFITKNALIDTVIKYRIFLTVLQFWKIHPLELASLVLYKYLEMPKFQQVRISFLSINIVSWDWKKVK